MGKLIALTVLFLVIGTGVFYSVFDGRESSEIVFDTEAAEGGDGDMTAGVPRAKSIAGLSHVWQTFNNCSSVALLIALSRWDIEDTQEKIALGTRPWNNPKGDNDDKHVTLYEMAEYAERYGLATYVRPNGDLETLKRFVANDIPVIARALTYPDQDFVHYRVVKGYDEDKKIVIESDGIEGSNQTYTYDEWMHMWKDFNYSYLIVVPLSKQALAEELLGAEKNPQVAFQNAKTRAEADIRKNPDDMRAHYNLITSLYYLGDYAATVREFEKIESRLTEHKLWYQSEPIEAYFNLKAYDRVIALADSVINNNNKSVSELYILKGKIYQERGDIEAARAEFEKAVYYNKSLKAAKEALASLSQ